MLLTIIEILTVIVLAGWTACLGLVLGRWACTPSKRDKRRSF